MASSAMLKEQLNHLMNSMFEMEFLGDYYKTSLEYLEQGSKPSFLAEIIPLFGEQVHYLLSQVSKLIMMGETAVNNEKIELYLIRILDNSLYLGATRMTLACNKLRDAWKEKDKERFVIALHEVRYEFEEVYKRLQKMLQLKREIQALDANKIGVSKL